MKPENPLSAPTDIRLSTHAKYVLEERGSDRDLISRVKQLPRLDYRKDARTGHFVAKFDQYRIVWRQDSPSVATILTVMTRDQFAN